MFVHKHIYTNSIYDFVALKLSASNTRNFGTGDL